MFICWAAKLRKPERKNLGGARKKVAEGESLKIVSESGVQSVMILSDMEFPCNQNLVVNGICDFDVHHKQLFATLLVLHLFLLFLLRELILDDEGYE